MPDLTRLPELSRKAVKAYRIAAHAGTVKDIYLIMAMEDLAELLERIDRPASTR